MAEHSPGERIKAAREAKGWNREELAVYAGISSRTVWVAETGKRDVTPKTLRLIGEVLGIDFFEEAAS